MILRKTRHATNGGNLLIGVDEAGLGPNLGPLVIAATCFRVDSELHDFNGWKFLADATTEESSITVADSKRVLAKSNGRTQLATTVLSAMNWLGIPSSRLQDLMGHLDPVGVEMLRQEHWYKANRDRPDTDFLDSAKANTTDGKWLDNLARAGMKLESIRAAVLFPCEFNARIEAGANKSEVEIAALTGLLGGMLGDFVDNATGSTFRHCDVQVDRLGGRKMYRTLVEDLAGDSFPQTLSETPQVSRYLFTRNTKPVEIEFRVRAESSHFAVAFASMVAKYIRERCMDQFNDFWSNQLPKLKPTAGYPTDAKRFLAEVRPKLKELAFPMDSFWRKR